MKTLVIYDSNKGNTAAIAMSIGTALGSHAKVVDAKAAIGVGAEISGTHYRWLSDARGPSD